MSGGVDSSVAAYLLKEKGFEVTGVTMSFGSRTRKAVKDAREVSRKLRIQHHVMNFSKFLEKEVIDNFVSGYLNSKTPNPCVECNKNLKFDILLKKALSLGFDFLATGHYARIEKGKNGFFLKKARDKEKDQSYFLYSIEKNALKHILFPLGELAKKEVRNIAKRAKLSVFDKPQSQDICFIPGRDFRAFLSRRINSTDRGSVLDLNGNVLGEHKGAFFYTIGQREGLGIGYRHPLYVVSKDTRKNEVIVGEKKDLKSKSLIAAGLNILVDRLPGRVFAQIRYNQKEAACSVCTDGEKMKVIFKNSQEAVTPGQSVVFYKGNTVLGGGVIEKVIK